MNCYELAYGIRTIADPSPMGNHQDNRPPRRLQDIDGNDITESSEDGGTP